MTALDIQAAGILEKANQGGMLTIAERNVLAEWTGLGIRFDEVTLEDVDAYINRLSLTSEDNEMNSQNAGTVRTS